MPPASHEASSYQASRYQATGYRSGFTLPELLVALTIFLTVAGGIALLFTGSIRTVRVGHQNIDVNEHIRAAMDLIETDLTQAFTSRDYGDYYTFYGTPIGMTFVGLVRPNRDNAQPNLSRITYVLYSRDPRLFVSYEDYAAGLPDNQPITFSLLRFVEGSRDSLDSLPLPPPFDTLAWPDPRRPLPAVAGLEGAEKYRQIYDELTAIYYGLTDFNDPWARNMYSGFADFLCEQADIACQDELMRAKRRELWIRMLAGDRRLPDFWSTPDNPNPNLPDYRDYVLAEDIVLIHPNATPELFREDLAVQDVPLELMLFDIFTFWRSRSDVPNAPTQEFYRPLFVYGSCCSSDRVLFFEFWNDHRNMSGLTARAAGIPEGHNVASFGSPLAPRIPMMVDVRMQFLLKSPYAGAPDLFRVFTKQIDVPSGYTRTDLTG